MSVEIASSVPIPDVATSNTRGGNAIVKTKIKFEGVEAARGIAAVLVVLYHAALHVEGDVGGKILWGLPHFGHAGVDFFFVLSGFIITFVHGGDIGHPERLPHYLQRRFTRVFPFYWVVLAFVLADLGVFHRQQFPAIGEIISNAFLLPQAKDQIVGGAWTLVFEITFYVAFAVAICNRLAGLSLLVMWSLLIFAGLILQRSPFSDAVLANASSAFCIEFILGMGTAHFLSRHRVKNPSVVLLTALLGFAAAGVLEVRGVMDGFGSLARIVYGALSVLIIAALVERERSTSRRVPRIMAILGRSSYAVYLVHLIAIGIGFKIISRLFVLNTSHTLAVWIALCVGGVLAGLVASSWIEQPAIRYARSLFRAPLK